MVRSVLFALLAVVVVLAQASRADPLPGYDDPELVLAVERWLETEDPLTAYADIGRLAAGGNLAAQYFANQVSYDPGWFDPTVSMTRAERLAFFPPDPADDRSRRFRPYEIDGDVAPELAASLAIGSETDVDAWIALAELMLDSGFRERVMQDITIALNSGRAFNIEVAQFAAGLMSSADHEITNLWWFLILETGREELFPDEARIARWTIRPGELLRQTGYFEALEEGVWSAVRTAAVSSHLELPGILPTVEDGTVVAAAERLFQARFQAGEAVAADLEALGRLLQHDRDQSPYLLPMSLLCEAHCGTDQLQCLAAGAVNLFDAQHGARVLEPVIDTQRYYVSSRAQDELLGTISNRFERLSEGLLPMPQCIIDLMP